MPGQEQQSASSTLPSLDTLIKETRKLSNNYTKAKKLYVSADADILLQSIKKNIINLLAANETDRKSQALFFRDLHDHYLPLVSGEKEKVKLLQETLKTSIADKNFINTKTTQKELEAVTENLITSKHLILGALIHRKMRIESVYKLTSPKNCRLYCAILKVLAVDGVNYPQNLDHWTVHRCLTSFKEQMMKKNKDGSHVYKSYVHLNTDSNFETHLNSLIRKTQIKLNETNLVYCSNVILFTKELVKNIKEAHDVLTHKINMLLDELKSKRIQFDELNKFIKFNMGTSSLLSMIKPDEFKNVSAIFGEDLKSSKWFAEMFTYSHIDMEQPDSLDDFEKSLVTFHDNRTRAIIFSTLVMMHDIFEQDESTKEIRGCFEVAFQSSREGLPKEKLIDRYRCFEEWYNIYGTGKADLSFCNGNINIFEYHMSGYILNINAKSTEACSSSMSSVACSSY